MRNVSHILACERRAWDNYKSYVLDKMGPLAREVQGDPVSHVLFAEWRWRRNQLDGVSQPRHKMNRMHAGRFSIRGRSA